MVKSKPAFITTRKNRLDVKGRQPTVHETKSPLDNLRDDIARKMWGALVGTTPFINMQQDLGGDAMELEDLKAALKGKGKGDLLILSHQLQTSDHAQEALGKHRDVNYSLMTTAARLSAGKK